MKIPAYRTIALIMTAIFVNVAAMQPVRAQGFAGLGDIPYLLFDSDSRTVIAANREFERWHPASLTKLMTAYVAMRAIAAGEVMPGSPVRISAASLRTPPTKMNYPAGTELRVDSALRILIVKSANDVSIALAESIAGSNAAFIGRMNAEAQRLGMADTAFANANGLHDAAQFTSARDLAILADAIWTEFPQYRDIFAVSAIEAGGGLHHSYNLLLDRFDGADGMKTGFVCASGYNMVASATRGGRRLVAIVLGADSQSARAVSAATLLAEGFRMAGTRPLSGHQRTGQPIGPRDLRAVMCSEKARQARYDPAPETAVIDSPLLHPRKPLAPPLSVATGGIDGPPSDAVMARAFIPERVPVPTPRPDFQLVDVDGQILDGRLLRGTVPVPMPSPRAAP